MTSSLSQIRESVQQWASAHPEVGVVLFGSRARGDHSPTSDVDLAVDVGPYQGEDAVTRYVFNRLAWREELTAALGLPVDLVRVGIPGRRAIQEAIARDGITLVALIDRDPKPDADRPAAKSA